ncbi:MAG: hypothetical protein LBP33_04255 [Candidatus Adiutrix sp.]|jgi:thiamine pyrophosphokinase|nr:hypothetical protein [Candidatus Adiutrix sp.]
MSVLNVANSIPGNLVKAIFESQKAITDQALKQAKVDSKMAVALKQQQTALTAVVMLTGIGGKVDSVL